MITLLTATPGGGKSAMLVSDFIIPAVEAGRPVYVFNIPELKVPHYPTPPVAEWARLEPSEADPEVMISRFNFEDGALIVLDEGQEIYRLRAPGSKVPPHVSAFERHRHQGLDFVIATQNPALVDKHVRDLCGRHLHVRATGMGRYLYEWPSAKDKPDDNFKSAPVSGKHKLPKHVFGLYKSASVHVKPVRRLPNFVKYLAVLAVVIVGFALYGTTIIDGMADRATASPVLDPVLNDQLDQHPTRFGQTKPAITPTELMQQLAPRLAGRPDSAPIYDGLRTVRTMPRVVACVAGRDYCRCYTQQATDAGLDPDQCRAWLKNPPFDPYADPPASPLPPAPVTLFPVDKTPSAPS